MFPKYPGWSVLLVLGSALVCPGAEADSQTNSPITADTVRAAAALIGLDFSEPKIEMMLPGLRDQLAGYQRLRQFPLSNSVPPALGFNPIPAGMKLDLRRRGFRPGPAPKARRLANLEELAFYSVRELGELVRSRQVSSEELTTLCLDRLKRYGPKLECVVTLLEERALQEARQADREILAGHYRGPLHGIPYGAKDLFAAAGAPTTWGAAPYTNQVFSTDATIIRRLREAGAVLVAKTTLGELAMGETWFGGMTRNPWNLKQGSSGSSAGSAAATAAGLLPFAIGSETYGSIVSPCDRCGVTGLRPTYGRVSRAGAMTLSWSMDKPGPICRTAEDCALVLNAVCGPDGIDQSVFDLPFNYRAQVDWKKLRVGFLERDFRQQSGDRKRNDDATLDKLRALGAKLSPVALPDYPVGRISFVLSTEGAAAFDDLTRSPREDWLKQQASGDWPNTFRRRRFVPAVEYLEAQRVRYLLIQDTARVFEAVDLIIAPSATGRSVLLSNLTGHPCVVVPNGFADGGTPTSICFLGKLFGEGEILAEAKAYQDATAFHLKHPRLD